MSAGGGSAPACPAGDWDSAAVLDDAALPLAERLRRALAREEGLRAALAEAAQQTQQAQRQTAMWLKVYEERWTDALRETGATRARNASSGIVESLGSTSSVATPGIPSSSVIPRINFMQQQGLSPPPPRLPGSGSPSSSFGNFPAALVTTSGALPQGQLSPRRLDALDHRRQSLGHSNCGDLGRGSLSPRHRRVSSPSPLTPTRVGSVPFVPALPIARAMGGDTGGRGSGRLETPSSIPSSDPLSTDRDPDDHRAAAHCDAASPRPSSAPSGKPVVPSLRLGSLSGGADSPRRKRLPAVTGFPPQAAAPLSAERRSRSPTGGTSARTVDSCGEA
eukprot:TRINITY_DN900_c4_g1_i1.p1 TRINITY_DN900_c4_g1~~TRINITY_DN900_c4_g1_i1.p1  ORF type:complete len:335 (+),score=68.22 TRINITY_DN900_c4_g1_i1:109-1113(+)